MLSFFDSRKRNAEDWRALIREVDSRFINLKGWTPEGLSRYSPIESREFVHMGASSLW